MYEFGASHNRLEANSRFLWLSCLYRILGHSGCKAIPRRAGTPILTKDEVRCLNMHAWYFQIKTDPVSKCEGFWVPSL